MSSPPAFKQLADGRYYTAWGGRRHYLGRDLDRALEAYHRSIREHKRWRDGVQASRAVVRHPNARLTVRDVYELFLASRRAECSPATVAWYRTHLRAFVDVFGDVPISRMETGLVRTYRTDQAAAPISRKTLSHRVTAVKVMLRWAQDEDDIPCPDFRLDRVRPVPLDPSPDRAYTAEHVRWMVVRAWELDRRLAPWVAVHYLCGLRPSEVTRLMSDAGRWIEPDVYEMPNKVGRSTGLMRYVVFSPEALRWMSYAGGGWRNRMTYSHKVSAACGCPSHYLRHSAATHLALAGVERATIDLFLGHVPKRVSGTYHRTDFPILRATARKLALCRRGRSS